MQRFVQAVYSLETLAKPANAGAAFLGAIVGPLIAQAFGSGKFWVYALLIAIVVADWIAGSVAAKKTGTFSSEYGIAGVFRTTLLLWIPFIGWLLDKVTLHVFGVEQPGYAFYALTIALAYHSWESMTANAYRAGWEKWIPKFVVEYISSEIKAKAERAMKQKGENKQ
ncbi:phage holin family protein [Paenibacillus naphthalenovorans]|uniref:phage holin family protein n=1 Tax=Paenibacillus naphthalenovorans TaxID=162209 RepID=UPI00088F5B4F|nr:phage holin family protein [Paenibacillus naphthalenovorans]SDJ93113.1 Bacteriophage holin family protein [Paenibacillus naphthalenovorans]